MASAHITPRQQPDAGDGLTTPELTTARQVHLNPRTGTVSCLRLLDGALATSGPCTHPVRALSRGATSTPAVRSLIAVRLIPAVNSRYTGDRQGGSFGRRFRFREAKEIEKPNETCCEYSAIARCCAMG